MGMGLGAGLCAGQVAAFTPASIAGLQLWLKADAGTFQDSGLTTPASADGNPVGGWVDQSSAGNNATQATAGLRATLKLNIQNSKPVIRFGGTQWLGLSGLTLTDHTIFFVIKDTTTGSSQGILGRNADLNSYFLLAGTSRQGNYWDGTNNPAIASVFPSPDAFALVESNRTSTTWRVFKNGTQVGTDQTVLSNSLTGTAIGNANGIIMSADVGEIVAYNSYLSAGNFTLVRNYLNGRWSLF
jgi:hypothetical protein